MEIPKDMDDLRNMIRKDHETNKPSDAQEALRYLIETNLVGECYKARAMCKEAGIGHQDYIAALCNVFSSLLCSEAGGSPIGLAQITKEMQKAMLATSVDAIAAAIILKEKK